MEDRLDFKKQGLMPEDMAMEKVVRYRPDVGVYCQVSKAYGLPAGLYTQCFTYVMELSEELRDEKFVTKNLDMTSLQSSPVWRDSPQVSKTHNHCRVSLCSTIMVIRRFFLVYAIYNWIAIVFSYWSQLDTNMGSC